MTAVKLQNKILDALAQRGELRVRDLVEAIDGIKLPDWQRLDGQRLVQFRGSGWAPEAGEQLLATTDRERRRYRATSAKIQRAIRALKKRGLVERPYGSIAIRLTGRTGAP